MFSLAVIMRNLSRLRSEIYVIAMAKLNLKTNSSFKQLLLAHIKNTYI